LIDVLPGSAEEVVLRELGEGVSGIGIARDKQSCKGFVKVALLGRHAENGEPVALVERSVQDVGTLSFGVSCVQESNGHSAGIPGPRVFL